MEDRMNELERRLAALEAERNTQNEARGHGPREGRGVGPRGMRRGRWQREDGWSQHEQGPEERSSADRPHRDGGHRRGPWQREADLGQQAEGPEDRTCGGRPHGDDGHRRDPRVRGRQMPGPWGEHERGPRGPWAGGPFGRGDARDMRRMGRFRRVAEDMDVSGVMLFRGYHAVGEGDDATEYVWGMPPISTDDVLAMDDARNVKVLTALAHPVRLSMMKAILQKPGTAADLRGRLGLTSTGQTYHALNMLQNGGMIEQQPDGTYTAVGDKAAGFLILLGGLYNLTEGPYDPAFLDVDLDSDDDEASSDLAEAEPQHGEVTDDASMQE